MLFDAQSEMKANLTAASQYGREQAGLPATPHTLADQESIFPCTLIKVNSTDHTYNGPRDGMMLQELARRSFQTEEEREAKLPGIRDVSRQEYLKKREEQKLQELKDAIQDEELLFQVTPAPFCTAIGQWLLQDTPCFESV